MTRDEMLNKLHQTCVGAELTVLPSEDAIECQYVTPNGYTYEWIGIDDWPLYELCNLSMIDLGMLKKKIATKSLTHSDIESTALQLFVESVLSDLNKISLPELNDFFYDLCNINADRLDALYVFIRKCDNKAPSFFSTYEELSIAFVDRYTSATQRWEDLDDSDLTGWIERLECEMKSIPMFTVGDTE